MAEVMENKPVEAQNETETRQNRAENRGEGRTQNNRRDGRRDRERSPKREDDGLDKRLVSVRRVTKVVKGGRTLRFSALVVVGDGKGNVGMGIGKANEVPIAIDKATVAAKKTMKKISLVEGTIPHETTGKFGTTNIFMMPAEQGHGVIAGGAARAVLEAAGVKNIVTKIHGSTNGINVVKATLNGLYTLKTREEIAARRGKKPEEI